MAQFRAEKAGINAEVQQKVRRMPLFRGKKYFLNTNFSDNVLF